MLNVNQRKAHMWCYGLAACGQTPLLHELLVLERDDHLSKVHISLRPRASLIAYTALVQSRLKP